MTKPDGAVPLPDLAEEEFTSDAVNKRSFYQFYDSTICMKNQ